MRLALGILGALNVCDQAVQSALESEHVRRSKPRVQESRRLLLIGGRDELVGRLAEHHRRECTAPELVRQRVVALEHEETRDTPVVHLGESPDLASAHDPDETRLLEHLQVVAGGALRNAENLSELGRAGRSLFQKQHDPRAESVTKSAKLLRLLDDQNVVELVVRVTVDDRGTYGKSRPFASGDRVQRSVEPIVVEVARGEVVEARHLAHAVAVLNGKIVVSAGDPDLLTHFRSAAKPLQALPVVRARPDLDEVEIAIASASHLGRLEQLAAVRSLLAKAPAEEVELECGTTGSEAGPTPVEHNCSGKHAGMLALCRTRGWESPGYRLAEHPCQRAMLTEVAGAAEVDPRSIPTGVDGCGVLTFGLTLERMAHAFSRFESLDGGPAVARAMRAHPDLIRGPGAPDTEVMRSFPGWVAKGGAEALLCAASPDGLGVVVKIEDGSGRALLSAVGAFLERLGLDARDLGVVPLENSRGETVGEIRPSG